MIDKRITSVAILVLASFGQAFGGSSSELAIGKTQEGILTRGESQSHALSLNAGDFVEVKITQQGAGLLLIVYGPTGSKVRGFRLSGDGEVGFISRDTGRYRLEVTPDEKTKEGRYSITLTRVVALDDRLAPIPPSYESPRIKALREAVANGQQDSVMAFWDEVRKTGAPLIEPIEADQKNMFVTFLWKGTSETKNVLVLWNPYVARDPNEYLMSRLANTDVWYKTLLVGSRERFIYRLAPNAFPLERLWLKPPRRPIR